MSKKFLIRSLGCKVSQYDAQQIFEKLIRLGLEPAKEEPPDLFILNSCSVTGRASQKTRQALHAAHKEWPHAKIILAGCETALIEKNYTEECSTDFDGIVPLNPTDEILERMLIQLGIIDRVQDHSHDQLRFNSDNTTNVNDIQKQNSKSLHFQERTRAFIKIQDGCNQFCTYCIVPHLRGRERSRSMSEVVQEARNLAKLGIKEIVLTGIHLGRFAGGLVPMLRELERIEGLARIRLSSIEPLEVTDDLIEWLATSPVACKHLHLPLQAGTDEILRAMNRPYTTADFNAVVERVRRQLPHVGLTTDFIVGFPGETDELFEKGLAFLERMAFSRIHIFRFSPRPGTPAATMSGQVDNKTKHARAKAVEQVWHKSAEAFHKSFIGQEVEVLWENRNGGYWQGYSREYIHCTCSEESGYYITQNMISRHRVSMATHRGLQVS